MDAVAQQYYAVKGASSKEIVSDAIASDAIRGVTLAGWPILAGLYWVALSSFPVLPHSDGASYMSFRSPLEMMGALSLSLSLLIGSLLLSGPHLLSSPWARRR